MSDWAREYFERGYAQRWGLPPTSDHVRRQTAGFSHLLQLAEGSRVIDIGCGHGRHSLALAARGNEVIGIDFAGALLTRARHLGANLAGRVRWILGDMRRLPLRSGCADAAMLLDAFGFFDTEEENDVVLREAARVLRDDGRLGLKVVNGRPILEAFRETDREEREGTVVAISRTLTVEPSRMTEKISVTGIRGNGVYERRQRLYGVDELRAAFGRAGFSVAVVFATPDGAAFEPGTSSTMWIVARRRRAD